jgi:hypothetical protein
MADSLAHCLYYHFRKKGNLLEGKVVSATPQQQASEPDTPAPGPKRKKVTADKPPKATELQAALQKLLTDLQIRHYNRVKALKTNAGRLCSVYKHNLEHTRELLLLLDKYNRKGIAVNSEQHLADRLAHLKH